MSRDLRDTIVAVATAPGVAALSMIRVSGPGAARVLRALVPPLSALPVPRRAGLVRIVHPETGEELDRALLTWFPGPGSFTGEDAFEISAHGGILTPTLIEEACRAAGARAAGPGEFTRRAYEHGRLDLVQAEAIADLIEGRSRALHRAALRQVERGLSLRLGEVRAGLVELEALLVHHIDFPEEDDQPVPLEHVLERAQALSGVLERLLATAPEGELLRSGALTVLAGRPNVGKSSVFNALLGEERALVTEVPGTTRDALEAEISVGGFPFRLVDTAGLHASEGVVERLGIEVARRFLKAADLVLLCVEAGRELASEEFRFVVDEVEGAPVVCVRTKLDLLGEGAVMNGAGARAGEGVFADAVAVSVRTGVGLEALRDAMAATMYRGLAHAGAEAPVVTRARHARALERAQEEVRAFGGALRRGVSPEVAAAHVRAAEAALEEILGIVTSDEVLDRVFGSFCIGK